MWRRLLVATGKLKPRSKEPTEALLELVRNSARSKLEQCAADPRTGPVAERIVAELRDQLAHPEKYTHQLAILKPRCVTMHDEKGDWYELDVRRLPRQASLDATRSYLETEFFGTILQWFDRQGVLPPRDRKRLQHLLDLDLDLDLDGEGK